MNDFFLIDVKLEQFEVDELWTTIKKNKNVLSAKAQESLMKVMHGSTHA
jgi:hypothetical protein